MSSRPRFFEDTVIAFIPPSLLKNKKHASILIHITTSLLSEAYRISWSGSAFDWHSGSGYGSALNECGSETLKIRVGKIFKNCLFVIRTQIKFANIVLGIVLFSIRGWDGAGWWSHETVPFTEDENYPLQICVRIHLNWWENDTRAAFRHCVSASQPGIFRSIQENGPQLVLKQFNLAFRGPLMSLKDNCSLK